MHLIEHEKSVARLYHETESRWRWRYLWAPLLRVLACGAVLAMIAWICAGNDCGDVAHADPVLVPAVEPAVPLAPDAEAFALAARMRTWQPTWRERQPGELAEVATAIVEGCAAHPWPSAERCPDLTAALLFRESSWRSNAIGRRGERGLGQLHGAALAGETREAVMDPATNVRLTLAWLRRCSALCRLAGHGEEAAALSVYAGLRCKASLGARLVVRWAEELHAAVAR